MRNGALWEHSDVVCATQQYTPGPVPILLSQPLPAFFSPQLTQARRPISDCVLITFAGYMISLSPPYCASIGVFACGR